MKASESDDYYTLKLCYVRMEIGRFVGWLAQELDRRDIALRVGKASGDGTMLVNGRYGCYSRCPHGIGYSNTDQYRLDHQTYRTDRFINSKGTVTTERFGREPEGRAIFRRKYFCETGKLQQNFGVHVVILTGRTLYKR